MKSTKEVEHELPLISLDFREHLRSGSPFARVAAHKRMVISGRAVALSYHPVLGRYGRSSRSVHLGVSAFLPIVGPAGFISCAEQGVPIGRAVANYAPLTT